MNVEDEVMTSPLSTALDIGNRRFTINVFKGTLKDDDWFFEVVDGQGRVEISQEMYSTDRAALDAALRVLHAH